MSLDQWGSVNLEMNNNTPSWNETESTTWLMVQRS